MGCFTIKGQCKSRETLPWTCRDCTRFPWRWHVHRVCEIEVSITIFSRLTILLVMPRVADNGVRSAMPGFFFSTVLMTPLTFTRRRLLVTNCSRHQHLSPPDVKRVFKDDVSVHVDWNVVGGGGGGRGTKIAQAAVERFRWPVIEHEWSFFLARASSLTSHVTSTLLCFGSALDAMSITRHTKNGCLLSCWRPEMSLEQR